MSQNVIAPESTAARVALWRALHTELEQAPLIFEDRVGLELLGDDEDWRQRPDMHPQQTASFRASIVARARFIEDYVQAQLEAGIQQYVILGAGLDSFAQRRPELLQEMQVFEVDQAGPQRWKRQRLKALHYAQPSQLHFVEADFEQGWQDALLQAGFDLSRPAIAVSTGVSMYLSHEANLNTCEHMSRLAPGSSFISSFILPVELVEPEYQAGFKASMQGAARSGHPFMSLYRPEDAEMLMKQGGFAQVLQVPSRELAQRYFQNRNDGFTLSSGEELMIGLT